MESSILSTKRLLAAVLHEHYNHRYWYYGLTLPCYNSNSFASYLEMNEYQYHTLLCSIGIGKITMRKGKERIELIKKEWELFLNDCGLGYVYFDQLGCNKVPKNGIDAKSPYIKYHGWWIGVGSADLKGITASTQFEYYNNPPRIHGRKSRLTRELKVAVRVLEEEKIELIEDSRTDGNKAKAMKYETEGKDDVHSYSKTNIASALEVNISSALDQFKQNRMGKEDVTQQLLSAIMKETIEQLAKERTKLLKELFRVPGVDEECT